MNQRYSPRTLTPHHVYNAVSTLGLLLVVSTTTSCEALDDMNRTGGNSKKGYFSISPDADLAKGAHLEWTVVDYESFSGGDGAIGLDDVNSEKDAVAAIAHVDSDGIIDIKGVGKGESRISFSAKADEQTIEDSFDVRVVEVTDLTFYPCSTDGAYVRGERALIPYRFNPSASKDVLGLGLYPLTLSPESGASLEKAASTTTAFSLSIADDAPSTVTIRSKLTGDDSALALYIVDRSDFDGVTKLSSTTAERGQTLTLDLRPLVNGRPVCSAVRRVLRSLVPSACSITGGSDGCSIRRNRRRPSVSMPWIFAR